MRPRLVAFVFLFASHAMAAMQVTVVRMISRPADVSGRGSTVLAWLIGKREDFLFERPYAVAWDDDALLVADPGAHRLFRIAGTHLTSTAEEALDEPVGVAACDQGIVVTDSARGQVILLDRSLRHPRVLAENVARPTGVVCRGDEVFVVATGEHRLLIVNVANGTVRTIGVRGEGPGQFNYPAAIAAGPSSLFIGDTLNFRVQQIDPLTGEQRSTVGALGDGAGDTPRIKGLAVDAGGRLWISDAHLDRLSVFAAAGNLIASVGGPGGEGGQFSFPAGLAVAGDGRIAVADSLNRRIQILRVSDGGQR